MPVDPKGKATKKLATKKQKYPDADTARQPQLQRPQNVQKEEVLAVV